MSATHAVLLVLLPGCAAVSFLFISAYLAIYTLIRKLRVGLLPHTPICQVTLNITIPSHRRIGPSGDQTAS